MNCEFCDKSFSTKNDLIQHFFEVHDVKLECNSDANKSVECHSTVSDCCSLCGESHETESCVTFVTLQIVSDTFTLSRARLTLPQGLSVYDRVDGSTAVIAKAEFRIGVRFGPFKARTSTTLSPKVNFPLKLFDVDESWDDGSGCVMYTDLYLETDDEHGCNWMCLIGPAGSADEQNLLCFQMKQELYYLVVKDVNVGDELKVWYAPYYAKRMSSTKLIQPGPMSSDVQIPVCNSPDILDSSTDQTCCIAEASCSTSPILKVMPTHSDSKVDYGKNSLWSECLNSDRNIVKKRSRAGRKKLSKSNTLRTSYDLCFDSSVLNSGNSSPVFKIRCVTVNDNESSNVSPDCTKFSPLLLGATELKKNWKCSICNNVEFNVASHAKHLMEHYKDDKADERNCFSQKCACGIFFKTRKKLEHHRKVCSQMVIGNESVSKKNNCGDVPPIVSGGNDKKDGLHSGLLPICPTGLMNFEKVESNISGVNNLHEQSKSSPINNVVQLQQDGSGSIIDFNISIESNFASVNTYCDKDTDFQCFSITDTLRDIEEGRNGKEMDHKILDIVKDGGHNDDILSRSCTAVDSCKLESNEQTKNVNSSIPAVKESDCLLNVGNIPPILDLTDDEVIVFQSIKNFTQPDNSKVSNKSVPGNSSKTQVTSVDFDNFKDYCQIKILSSGGDDCEHNYAVDFHDTNLIQESFNFGDLRGGRSMDPFNDATNKKFIIGDPNHYSIDKNDSLNSLLNSAATGLVNENCLSFDNDITSLKIDKSVIGNSREINTDLKDEVNNLVLERFQDHQVPLQKAISCDESNLSVTVGVHYGFSNKENNTNNLVPVKSFLCDICGKKFSRSIYLRRHLRKHTGEFCCLSCMTVFARKESLSNHVCSTRRNVLRLLEQSGKHCKLCGKLLKNKTQFKEHQASCGLAASSVSESDVADAKKVACIYCGEICEDLNDLKVHTDICLRRFPAVEPLNRQFLCDKCGVLCSSKRSLSIHLKAHGEPLFCCPICQKKYYRNDLLQKHMVTHQSVGPSYECPVCDKKLKTKMSLHTHLKIHTGSKRFKCDQCSMAFYQKVNLKKHLQSLAHKQRRQSSENGPISNKNGDTICLTSGDNIDNVQRITTVNEVVSENGVNAPIQRTFKCNICSQIFLEERRLKTHVKRVHRESGNFVCKICNTVLKHKPSLKRHIKKRHPTERNMAVNEIDSSALVVSANTKEGLLKCYTFLI